MILGADHLALSVTDTDQVGMALKRQGFANVFMAKKTLNHPAKAHLLAHYSPVHDLAVFKPTSGIAIEITNHGPLLFNEQGPYMYAENEINLQTPDLESEKIFWQKALRFKEDGVYLKLLSPVSQWSSKLLLTENKNLKLAMLDSLGYCCMAFFSNDLKNDARRAAQLGAWDITEIFQILVNHKNLDIIMFRTPGGAICELIQLRK